MSAKDLDCEKFRTEVAVTYFDFYIGSDGDIIYLCIARPCSAIGSESDC